MKFANTYRTHKSRIIEALKAVGFSCGLVLMLWLFLNTNSSLYKKTEKQKFIERDDDISEIEVVSLGSSHARYGVKTDWLTPPAATFPSDGQDLFETATKAMAAKKMFPNLKTVLMSISYFSFWYDNGQYSGPNDRNGKRINLYAGFPQSTPVFGDWANYAKGRLANIITKDHLEKWFLASLKLGEGLTKADLVEEIPPEDKNYFLFTENENSIPNQLYVPLDDSLTLIGYQTTKQDVYSCSSFVITWYIYCHRAVTADRRFYYFAGGKREEIQPISSHGNFHSAHPIDKWEKGTIINFRQTIRIPADWKSRELSVAMITGDAATSPPKTPKKLFSKVPWPTVKIHFPEKDIPVQTRSHGAIALKNHACIRAEAYLPIMYNMLENHPALEEDAYQTMKRTIESLQDDGIRVILYTPPYHQAYNIQFPKKWRTGTRVRAFQLMEETGVEYHDFSHHPAYETNVSLFKNSDHLNTKGAQIFTKKIDELVMQTPHSKKEAE